MPLNFNKIQSVGLIVLITFSIFSVINFTMTPNSSNAASFSSSEPLVPSTSSITKSFTFPVLEFEGQTAANLTETITWHPNGTTVISDSRGYRFGLTIPSTNATVTILQNSTVVDEKFSAPALHYEIFWKPVKNSEGIVDKYEFTIIGNTTAGSSSKISLGIDSYGHYAINKNNRFLVANPAIDNSTEGLGIDWSDAIAEGYTIQYDAPSSSLVISVGKSFSIDPSTVAVGPTSVSPSTNDYYEGQRRVVKVNGVWFAFYYDNSNIVYKTSTDNGATWSANATSVVTGTLQSDQYRWTITETAYGGSPRITVFYFTGVIPAPPSITFWSKRGTVLGTSITWDSATSVFTGTGDRGAVFAAADSNGNLWQVFRYFDSSLYQHRFYKSTNAGLTWSFSYNFADSGVREATSLTRLSSGKMLLAQPDGGWNGIDYRIYDGVSWSTSWLGVGGAGLCLLAPNVYQASSDSNSSGTAFLAYNTCGSNGGTLKVATWFSNGTFYRFEDANTTSNHWLPSITVSTDNVVHLFSIFNGQIVEKDRVNGTWQASTSPFGSTFFSPNQLTSGINRSGALWIENSTNLRFGSTDAINDPPIANSGPPQTVGIGTWVTLDGSASFDPEGQPITYSWTQTAGPSVSLYYGTTAHPVFLSPSVSDDTTLTFQLVVNDGVQNGSPSTVNILVIAKVSSSTDPRLDSSGEQRTTYYDGTRQWAFYYDGSNIVYKYSSDNGGTWSTAASTVSGALASKSYYTIYGEGNKIMVSYASSSSSAVYVKNGTISSTSITWASTPQTVLSLTGTLKGQNYLPSLDKAGSNYFLAFNVVTGTQNKNQGYVYKTATIGGSWGTASTTLYNSESTASPVAVGITKYGSTNAVVIYALNGESEFRYQYYTGSWSCTSLSKPCKTTNAGLTAGQNKTNAFSITYNGTCAWVGYTPSNAGGNLKTMKFCSPTSITFSTLVNFGTNKQPSITTIGNDIHLYYLKSSGLSEIINVNGTWGAEGSPFGSNSTQLVYPHAAKTGYQGHHVMVAWREGNSSPYNIKAPVANLAFDSIIGYLVSANSAGQTSSKFQAEDSIVAHTTNQNVLIDSFIDYARDANGNPIQIHCNITRSTDGGQTWNNVYTMPYSVGTTGQSDPVVTVNSNGTMYEVCMSYDNALTTSDLLLSTSSSASQGASWSVPTQIVHVFNSSGVPLQDKPNIAVDRSSNVTTKNNVYVCWDSAPSTAFNTLKFVRVQPNEISSPQSIALNSSGLPNGNPIGCSIGIGPNGQVFVVYENITYPSTIPDPSLSGRDLIGEIDIVRSYNGGKANSWTYPLKVADINRYRSSVSEFLDELLGYHNSLIRAHHFPTIAVDQSGVLHIAYGTNSSLASGGIAIIKYVESVGCQSFSGSCSFTSPITINIDGTRSDHFMPQMIISTRNGSPIVHVVVLDKRDDSNNVFYRPYDYHCSLATSCTDQVNWVNTIISSTSSTNYDESEFVGDYHGLAFSLLRESIPTWTQETGPTVIDIYGDRSRT